MRAIRIPPHAFRDLGIRFKPGSRPCKISGGTSNPVGRVQVRATPDHVFFTGGRSRRVHRGPPRVAGVNILGIPVTAELGHVSQHVYQPERIGLNRGRGVGSRATVLVIDHVSIDTRGIYAEDLIPDPCLTNRLGSPSKK